MGVLRIEVAVAAIALASLAACGDPDQYLRHAKSDAGTLPVTTGDPPGAAGATGTAGAAGGSGGRATGGAAGAGATTGEAGTAGGAGATATGGAAGAGTTSGAAGAGANGAAGATATGGAAGAETTSGAAGANGGAGGAATCPGCKIEVVYTCLGTGTDSRNFVVEAKNAGSTIVLFKELTLRYWYTADASKEQELDCDTAEKLGCGYIVKSTDPPPKPQPAFVAVTPARPKANEYVELAIVQGAMDVGGTTGRIQLRLHNKDFSAIDQNNDYSYDCGSVGQAHDSPKVTAYIRGVLVGGTEPQ
jgi:hypothetical protein